MEWPHEGERVTTTGFRLDPQQQAVVDHPGGPLLVIAGPGSGKTTTLVEAIVERVERRGADPASVLALTFSRKAADDVRQRVLSRLQRTTSAGLCFTFHSFAYGLLRRFAPAELYTAPLRLLSAPEADAVLRELLHDHPEAVQWPERLRLALGTRGFTREVQAVLSRAREKGLEPEGLADLGRQQGVPEFIAAAVFLEQYLTVLDSQGATDYPDLIRRATLEAAAHRDELRAEFQHIFVDEYQDTDPGQIALLTELAGGGRNLIAVGDPHQSIYGFRGADVRGIAEFPATFPAANGAPAPVVVLPTARRFGGRLLVATQRIADQLPWPGELGAEVRTAYQHRQVAPGAEGAGRVEVLTFDSDRGEAEHIADLLRRAHLEDGVPWSEMAVLARSGRAVLPPLRRALAAAGVPVEIAADEVPLARDPAVQQLLDPLRAALQLDVSDPADRGYLDYGRVVGLLTGPLAGLDAADLRQLARALRSRAAVTESEPDASGARATSRQLMRGVLADPEALVGLNVPAAEQALGFARLLHETAELHREGGRTTDLLWHLWSATEWPDRLRRQALSGGPASSRGHRDLDAICALFDLAERLDEQRNYAGAQVFLDTVDSQEFPADTLAERGIRGESVRLLTAHRAKGLEWRLVVVAHVQDGSWPDLRRRSTLLGADRIGATGVLLPPLSPRALAAEERRLFYVAATRARDRLVVTAVASTDDDGEQPSSLLAELGVEARHAVGRPARPLSMVGVVSQLRRALVDPSSSTALKQAAARRLARLAAIQRDGLPVVPGADPANWWGSRDLSRSEQPLRPASDPVPVSASMLNALAACPAQWFFQKEAGGAAATVQAAYLGQIVHAAAERVVGGEFGGDVTVEELLARIDEVWSRLHFRTPWSQAREYQRVTNALTRFLAWHRANRRQVVGVEQRFSVVVDLPSGEQVRLRGAADRLELDGDGRIVVVDLKTGKNPPSNKSVLTDTQLALYQAAVEQGAFDRLAPEHAPVRAGGAELVQLGKPDPGDEPLVQVQPPYDEGHQVALMEALERAVAMIRAERFPAVVGSACERCSFESICPSRGAQGVLA